ncbi:hypothetical protein [Microvirga calopogonii]|uniref:hypothetical protein n=1 Tax=Microvirga calopogonii TaxID=2078013 RepID=UPI000E0D2C44|nr:hypothetical protein [Microvirga calopogonii]
MKFLHMLLSLTVLVLLSTPTHAQSLADQWNEYNKRKFYREKIEGLHAAHPAMLDLGKARKAIKAGCKTLRSRGEFDNWLDRTASGEKTDGFMELQCCQLYGVGFIARATSALAGILNPYQGPKIGPKTPGAAYLGVIDGGIGDATDAQYKDLAGKLEASGKHTWESTMKLCQRVIEVGAQR